MPEFFTDHAACRLMISFEVKAMARSYLSQWDYMEARIALFFWGKICRELLIGIIAAKAQARFY